MLRRVFLTACMAMTSVSGLASIDDRDAVRLTFPKADLLYGASSPSQVGVRPVPLASTESQRSVPLAFAMSAAVPGLGQIYNRSWWQAGLAVVAEAALITAYVSWRNKGNDGVAEYEQYAHLNWSPIRYAQWLNAYSGYPGSDIQLPEISDNVVARPETWTESQRQAVEDLIDDIRAAERQSIYLQTGAGFSHVLPFFGEQQYYELIGKYFQYAPGWDDYTYDPDALPAAVMPSDAKFYFYSGIHADANDYLRRSSWAGAFVIINHFAAAVQAGVSARLYNISVSPTASVRSGPSGETLASAGFVVDF